jgi:glycosyltransferase involved in cell wall biosynthesis
MIVAFTKDWNDVPTCTTHILRCMARERPVLWIESIGVRRPSLATVGDLPRLWHRLKYGLSAASLKESQLRVMAPLLIPKTQSRFGLWFNRRSMALRIAREARRMDGSAAASDRREYWCFVPNAVDLLPERRVSSVECRVSGAGKALPLTPDSLRGRGHSPLVVYYCVDDWSKFHNLDGAWLARKEEELLRRTDIVFTPARYLEAKCRAIAGDRVHYVPHGVEYALFGRALAEETRIADDLAGLPRPLIGFYGNLHPWIDFDLVEQLAGARPAWSFVLIGEVFCDVSRLRRLANVHLLGRREHQRLPEYCKAFAAAVIPYDMRQPRMASVNPVKTRELLAAGVPIVAADLPELRGMQDVCIARAADEWMGALERQIGRADRQAISRRMAEHDWSVVVRRIRERVECCAC